MISNFRFIRSFSLQAERYLCNKNAVGGSTLVEGVAVTADGKVSFN